MLGASFEWSAANPYSAYPFTEKQPDGLNALIVDFYLRHNQPEQGLLHLSLFDPSGYLSLSWSTGVALCALTPADNFHSFDFGEYTVYQWQRSATLPAGFTSEDYVVRLTVNSAQRPNFPQSSPGSYPLLPTHGVLLASLVNPQVKRVRRIGLAFAGQSTLYASTEKPTVLVGGYNTAFTLQPTDTVAPAGGRAGPRRVTLDVAPGLGLGAFSNCEKATTTPKTINSIAPDDQGNLQLEGTDCVWVERPVVTTALPIYPNTNYAITAARQAFLQLHQDCGPCCECTDYGDAYAAIERLWKRAQAASVRVNTALAEYKVLNEQVAELQCDVAQGALGLRLKLLARPGYTLAIMVLLTNNTATDFGLTTLTLDLAPTGFHYLRGSGRLDADALHDAPADPVIRGSQLLIALPGIASASFARYSCNVYYASATPSTVATVSAQAAGGSHTSSGVSHITLTPPLARGV